MSTNLKYSKSVIKDFEELSEGRKNYIRKRAVKKSLEVEGYLKLKYGVSDETE
jgi:hypothetical protein|tara:strand:+ start:199 stop:357 length:159 start_codon:yes stop_codon:yes gene_type:complete